MQMGYMCVLHHVLGNGKYTELEFEDKDSMWDYLLQLGVTLEKYHPHAYL